MELADEYGLEFWMSYGAIELGWAEAELGNVGQGIEQMQRALATYEATGAQLWSPYLLGLLADQPDTRSILTLEVRNPGVNMAEGERPTLRRTDQPLTRMAADAGT